MAIVLSGLKSDPTYLDEVERRMREEKPKNEFELKQALLKVWYNIDNGVTKKLVDSVPNRLHEVIRMNDYPTRY